MNKNVWDQQQNDEIKDTTGRWRTTR